MHFVRDDVRDRVVLPKTACAYRKSSPSILVMQSTQDRTVLIGVGS